MGSGSRSRRRAVLYDYEKIGIDGTDAGNVTGPVRVHGEILIYQ
jgi:hypothetical protein